jgi:hypothetical protein
MIGYEKCSNELILLADTDEFINIDMSRLNEFIKDKSKMIGSFNIYNMCDYNINYNQLVKKYILFKKKNISSLDHLNYLWLVGCKQEEKKIEYMSFLTSGTIYHQTLNRNKKNNIVKFVFYVLLYRKNNNLEYNLIDNYDNNYLLDNLTIDEILNIFIHSNITRINIPNNSSENILTINNNKFISDLIDYKNNDKDFYFINEMKCIKNVSVCFKLNINSNTTTILFDNVKSVNIIIYNIYLNEKYSLENYNFNNILNDTIIINHQTTKNIYNIVIQIKCIENKTNNHIFTIKNIFN